MTPRTIVVPMPFTPIVCLCVGGGGVTRCCFVPLGRCAHRRRPAKLPVAGGLDMHFGVFCSSHVVVATTPHHTTPHHTTPHHTTPHHTTPHHTTPHHTTPHHTTPHHTTPHHTTPHHTTPHHTTPHHTTPHHTTPHHTTPHHTTPHHTKGAMWRRTEEAATACGPWAHQGLSSHCLLVTAPSAQHTTRHHTTEHTTLSSPVSYSLRLVPDGLRALWP